MTRRRPTARRTPARGGQQGYEPPVTRMRRDERLLELALERWSQRQIAADVGLTQGGVSKALRRIFTRRLATLTQEAEASRVKLVLLAERRARAAREGHARSQADVTTRRQRKVAAGGGAAATTVVELDTQSAAGNPTYLAVEQRCDEFAAKLLGLYDPPHSQWARGHRPSIRPPPASASSATSRQTRWSVPMQNSPDLLTRALQNPTLLEAELGRRRARDGTDGDVLAWIEATFGVHIPAVACCPGHVAPAQAFCDALRARDQVALWIASRGFGGKTFLLALLAAANAILFETDVIILGGSGQQSARVVECLHRLLAAGQVPPAWLASEPTFTKTTFAWGNTIQALKASQTAVRGAHPTRLLLDEIDEMELRILEAAQGQPMDRDGVRAQTVMSSTHQHPDGTVTAMRRRAADLGWPVYEWCYRETLAPHGWLTEDQVTRKQWLSCLARCGPSSTNSRNPVPKDAPSTRPPWSGCSTPRSGHTSPRAISNTPGAASRVPPPSGPGLIRPGRGTASASTGPRSATTPSPSSCAAIPRRSRSSPSTASNGDRGRK